MKILPFLNTVVVLSGIYFILLAFILEFFMLGSGFGLIMLPLHLIPFYITLTGIVIFYTLFTKYQKIFSCCATLLILPIIAAAIAALFALKLYDNFGAFLNNYPLLTIILDILNIFTNSSIKTAKIISILSILMGFLAIVCSCLRIMLTIVNDQDKSSQHNQKINKD